MLGIAEEGGADVPAAPDDFLLHVRIAATDASEAQLRTLVATAVRRCPMASALQSPRTLQVMVEVAGS